MINFYRTVGLALFVTIVAPVAAQRPPVKVTLLGTGCPPAVMNRFGPSTLVEAGEQKFLFDAGRARCNVSWNSACSGRMSNGFSLPTCTRIMWSVFRISG